jgi:hypothetical protein
MINNDLKVIDGMSIESVRKLKGKNDFLKTKIMFIFKIKQQRMRIVSSVKIVERNFTIMFDILNVFYKNVKKSNNSVNKQKFFMMRNIKMQILLLKFVVFIIKNLR